MILAQSGRALAQAAYRAGYAPLVADLFGDEDTRQVAARMTRLPGSLGRAPGEAALVRALDRLTAGTQPLGVVYGSGFERRPALLEAMASRYPLLGNGAAVVRWVKTPHTLAALCRSCAVPHPEIAARPDGGDWLEKRAGGSGGVHIRPARPGRVRLPRYVQRRVAGEPVSALVLGDGRRAMVLGWTAQWSDPAPGQPFRYGGAVRPARVAESMTDAMERVAAAAGLVGLNAIDGLMREDGFDLLEINPRPGASIDAFADADGTVFRLHAGACAGTLPAQAPAFAGAAAACIAYARRPMTMPPGFAWPGWAADRPRSGTMISKGEPFCTALARADMAEAARTLATARAARILAEIEN